MFVVACNHQWQSYKKKTVYLFCFHSQKMLSDTNLTWVTTTVPTKRYNQTTSIETEDLKHRKRCDRHLVFWMKHEELIQSLTLITIWRGMTGGHMRTEMSCFNETERINRSHLSKDTSLITPQNKTTTHKTHRARGQDVQNTETWIRQSLHRNTVSACYKSQSSKETVKLKNLVPCLLSHSWSSRAKADEHLKCN